MKILLKILIVLGGLALFLLPVKITFAAGCTGTGSCYFNADAANCSDASNDTDCWVTTSGGSTAGGLPDTTDDCILDAGSSAGAYTFTVTSSVLTCKDFNIANPASGQVTIAGSVAVSVYGSYTISSDILTTNTGATTFRATSGSHTITTNGEAMAIAVTFDGAGGSWSLADTYGFTGGITVTRGSFSTNNQTVNTGGFSSNNTNVRTVDLTCSTITIAGSGSVFNYGTLTNLTFRGECATVIFTSVATVTIGGLTIGEMQFTVNSASETTPIIVGSPTLGTLRRTGNVNQWASLVLGANITATNTIEFAGNSSTTRLRILSNVEGTTRTIYSTSTSISISNVDFEDITFSAGTPSGDSIGNCGNNSGITFTAATTTYWVHPATASVAVTTQNWSSYSGGPIGGASAGRFPLCQDTAKFDANSFSTTGRTVTIGQASLRMGTVDWTGVTNAPVFSFNQASRFYGSMILTSGHTTAGTSVIILKGRGSYTLTSGGNPFTNSLFVEAPTGTYTLGDALSNTGATTVSLGNFVSAGYSITSATFNSNNTDVRGINIDSSVVTLTSITTPTWNLPSTTNLTFSGVGSTITFTGAGATSAFHGGAQTYHDFYDNTSGTGTTTVSGNGNVFNNIRIGAGQGVAFTQGTTNSVASFTVDSGAGTEVYLDSTTGTNFTLTKTGGGTVCLDYVIIEDSTATPGSTWYAGANSFDAGGGNVDWTFTACPAGAPAAGGGDETGIFFYE